MATAAKLKPSQDNNKSADINNILSSASEEYELRDTPNGLDVSRTQLRERLTAVDEAIPDSVSPRARLGLLMQETASVIHDVGEDFLGDGQHVAVSPSVDLRMTTEVFNNSPTVSGGYIDLNQDSLDGNKALLGADLTQERYGILKEGLQGLSQGQQQYILGEIQDNPNISGNDAAGELIEESIAEFESLHTQYVRPQPLNSMAAYDKQIQRAESNAIVNAANAAVFDADRARRASEALAAAQEPSTDSTATPPTQQPPAPAQPAPSAELSDDGELIIKAVNDNKLNSVLGLDNDTIRNGLVAAESKMSVVDDRIHLGVLHQELGNMAAAFAKPDQDLKTPLFKVARDSYNNSPNVDDGFIAFVGKTRPTENHPMSEKLTSNERDLILEGLKPLTQPEKQYVGAFLLDEPAASYDETLELVEGALRDFNEVSKKVNADNGVDPVSVFSEALTAATKAAQTRQNNPAPAQQQPQPPQDNLPTVPAGFSVPLPESDEPSYGAVDPSVFNVGELEATTPAPVNTGEDKKPKPSPSAEAAAKIAAEAKNRKPTDAEVIAKRIEEEKVLQSRSEVEILMKAVEENDFFSKNTDVGEIEARLSDASKKLDTVKPTDSMRAAVLHQEMWHISGELVESLNERPLADGSKPLVKDTLNNKSNANKALRDIAAAHFKDSHRIDHHDLKDDSSAISSLDADQVDLLHSSISRLPVGIRQHVLTDLKENLGKMSEHGFDDVVNSVKQSLHDFDSVYAVVNPEAKPQLKAFSEKLENATVEMNEKLDTPITLPDFKATPTPNISTGGDGAENTDTQEEKLTNDDGGKNDGKKDPKKDPRLEDDPNNPNLSGGGTQTKVTYSLFNLGNQSSHKELMAELQFAHQDSIAAMQKKEEAKAAKKEAKAEKKEAKQAARAERLAERQGADIQNFADLDNLQNPEEIEGNEQNPAAPSNANEGSDPSLYNADGTVSPARTAEIASLASLLDSPYEGDNLDEPTNNSTPTPTPTADPENGVTAPTADNKNPADDPAPIVETPQPSDDQSAAPAADTDTDPTVEAPTPTEDAPKPADVNPKQDSEEVRPPVEAPNPPAPPAPKKSLLDNAPDLNFNDSMVDNYYKGIQADYDALQTQMEAATNTPADLEMLSDKSEEFLYQIGALSEHLDDTKSNATAEELDSRSQGLDFIKTLKDDVEEKAEKKGLFSSNDYDPLADENNRATHPLKEKFNDAEEKVKEAKEGMAKQAGGLIAGLTAKVSGLFGKKP